MAPKEERQGTAFVTGGALGIGKAAVLQLLEQHLVRGVTVVDWSQEHGALLAQQINHQQHSQVVCHFFQGDLADSPTVLVQALDQHVAVFGEFPRIVLLNAGIGQAQPLVPSSKEATQSSSETAAVDHASTSLEWKRVVDINFGAVVEGIRWVVPRMMKLHTPPSGPKERGFIAITASAAGIIPLMGQEVYSATKAASIHLARSLAWLDQQHNIRVVSICPMLTDTRMARELLVTLSPQQQKAFSSSLLTPDFVASGILKMIQERGKYPGGSTVMVSPNRGMELWHFRGESSLQTSPASDHFSQTINPRLKDWATAAHGSPTFRAVEIATLGTDFSAVSKIVTKPIPPLAKLPPGHALVRIAYAGVNASDVNYSAGRYHGGPSHARQALPLPAGFESVGVVAAVGPPGHQDSSNHHSSKPVLLRPGTPVAAMYYGGFAEYQVIPVHYLLPVQGIPRPEHVALLTSGLTASIALQKPLQDAVKHHPTNCPTVIVTAAAGGTGQFAVQIAKLAGCKVVAVAGGESKGQLCRSLGADVVVDYKALGSVNDGESSTDDDPTTAYSKRLTAALKQACGSGGADIVYESVGGEMFNACERCLGNGGRLIVIGMMSQYTSGPGGGWKPSTTSPGLQDRLLAKGASIEGFFLLQHTKLFRRHYAELSRLLERGDIVAAVDVFPTPGIDATVEAVKHLQGGSSVGKVVLQMSHTFPSTSSRL